MDFSVVAYVMRQSEVAAESRRGTGELTAIPSGYLSHSHGKSPFLIGKPSINGPFSMAMLNKPADN